MAGRSKTAVRQAEIVAVTLDLLGSTPLGNLTTRQIAKSLSISQPALFRHFRSREQLLLAVMSRARDDLSALAEGVLGETEEPLQRLALLAARLLAHVERHPGLARLLFSPPSDGPIRSALRQLVSMQRSVVAQLIRDGQSQGLLRAALDPTEAAMFYVGMIQGIVLRAQLEDGAMSCAAEAPAMLSMWLEGTSARAVEGSSLGEDATVSHTDLLNALAVVDVRPVLDRGEDPLSEILASLASVRAGGVLSVAAPFRPTPLMRLVSERGHGVTARQAAPNLWCVDIVVDAQTDIVDLCDLEPPEPLQHVLEAVSSLSTGQCYLARLPQFPRMLVPHLEKRGADFHLCDCADGTALLHVTA